VSYFRPEQAGKIGPRTIHSFSDSTSRLSRKAGQVIPAKCAHSSCLISRVQSSESDGFWRSGAEAANSIKIKEKYGGR